MNAGSTAQQPPAAAQPAALSAPRPDGGPAGPSLRMLGEAGIGSAQQRTHDCARPVRLRGSTRLVNRATGEVRVVYSSSQELDGTTWVPCGNRRTAVCEPCSKQYKGDAYQVVVTGLAGGKGIPATVAEHPSCFTTLTAPSFGPVHGLRAKGPCRARRDKPVCEHGRPLWCNKRHHADDPVLGTPLCWECYDYRGHVVWNYYAPELWRRTSIALQRDLAKRCWMSVKAFAKVCKVSYSKAAEFQVRGLVHLHVPVRLDDPDGADGQPPDLSLTSEQLEDAIRAAVAHVRVDAAPLADGTVYRLRWGSQVDTRTITPTADRDTRQTTVVHPEQVASYVAKYLTKATEDFGLPARVISAAHANAEGASRHAVRIIEAAQQIAAEHPDYRMLLAHLGTFGYRGHPMTKSRAYSVNMGQLRGARRRYRTNPAGLDPDADVRELLDDDHDDLPDGFERISMWEFAGQGYLDLDQAAAAVLSATQARIRAHQRKN